MSVERKHLKFYGCAVEADDDSVTGVGGAIATSKKKVFVDVGAAVQLVAGGADTANVTLTYRDSAGTVATEVKALNGTTPVAFTAVPERILKAVKAASTTNVVAIEAQTATRTGTALGGGVDYIDLDAGAASADDTYVGQVFRATGGTGSGQIAEIIAYDGALKRAYLGADQATPLDNTTVFRISQGLVFDKTPSEILEIRRLCYAAAADDATGSDRAIHDKVFIKNTHGTLPLATASVIGDPAVPTFTDLTTTGAGSFTLGSAIGGFTVGMVGQYIRISEGTNFIAGRYRITARASTNEVTLATSPSPAGAGAAGKGSVGSLSFGVAATLNDTAVTGGDTTRLAAPTGIAFSNATKSVANSGSLTAGAAQGAWVCYDRAKGAAAEKTTYTLEVAGSTV